MICELLMKSALLIAVIHGLRAVGRRIGPRASGLLLGLPSSTAIVLFLGGRERGCAVAAEMAEASLLGLVAAVSLPLAYVQAARRDWRLPAVMAASVAAYLAVASGLGSLQFRGPFECVGLAFGAIALASYRIGRIDVASEGRSGFIRSPRWSALVRTTVPAVYVLLVGLAGEAASPSWSGLVSTFPSMSTVVLAVTHLEEGPAAASRIAKALPLANLSTAVFLTVFRFGCPAFGLGWGMLCGYAAAMTSLAAMEWAFRRGGLSRLSRSRCWRRPDLTPALEPWLRRAGLRPDVRSAPGHFQRHGMDRRKRFAPRVETLAC